MVKIPELELWTEIQTDCPLRRQRVEFKLQVLIYQMLEKNNKLLNEIAEQCRK